VNEIIKSEVYWMLTLLHGFQFHACFTLLQAPNRLHPEIRLQYPQLSDVRAYSARPLEAARPCKTLPPTKDPYIPDIYQRIIRRRFGRGHHIGQLDRRRRLDLLPA